MSLSQTAAVQTLKNSRSNRHDILYWYWSWLTQLPEQPTVTRAETLKTAPPLWASQTDFSCHLHAQATPKNNTNVTNTRPTEDYQPLRFLKESDTSYDSECYEILQDQMLIVLQ
jgi:hypothetical protein